MKGVAWSLLALILPLINFAQDKKIEIDINKKDSSQWYTQPWVWIVGGAVFILILIALLRGNSSSSDREVSRTTVIKDRDI